MTDEEVQRLAQIVLIRISDLSNLLWNMETAASGLACMPERFEILRILRDPVGMEIATDRCLLTGELLERTGRMLTGSVTAMMDAALQIDSTDRDALMECIGDAYELSEAIRNQRNIISDLEPFLPEPAIRELHARWDSLVRETDLCAATLRDMQNRF